MYRSAGNKKLINKIPNSDPVTADDVVSVANAPEFNFGYGDMTV
jgi:hypothetical protein